LPTKSFLNVHLQFPLQIASCITSDKSQGQEYDAVLYDKVRPSFSQGHTYVTLSRVKQHDTIALFVSEESVGANAASISNFVFKNLLT
jgi:glycine betaine/choline ABC-type transport system substrate-binding protein